MVEKGPIYGVELIDTLPLGKAGGMLQAMPNRDDLRGVRCARVAAGYEVLLAHYLELRNQQPAEPTYTMSQAIDRIVDGLRLEWKDDGPRGRIKNDWTAIRRGVMYRVIQFHDRIVCITPLANIVVDSVLAGKDICLTEVKNEVQAELEQAVANHG